MFVKCGSLKRSRLPLVCLILEGRSWDQLCARKGPTQWRCRHETKALTGRPTKQEAEENDLERGIDESNGDREAIADRLYQ